MSDPESAVLSKEDLEYIETRLAIVGFPVDLQCDEFRARIFRARKTDMRDCLIVYVNGVFKFYKAL